MPSVFVELLASIGDFEAKMGTARATMEATAKHGEGVFGSMSTGVKTALAGGVVAAVVGVGAAAVKMASDFEASMTRLVTQAGVSEPAMKGLTSSVLGLAGQVGFSPTSLSEALFHVESSFASTGISGKAAMDILKTAAEGAQIGNANLVDVTNALDAAVVSGIPGVQNYSQAMGALNAIVGSGDMTMSNLAEALGSGVLAVVKNYGLSLTDVGAALAVFGDNNIRGAQAATYLRMSVQSMAVPMKAGQVVLESIGMTADQMAKDMQHGGLNTALEDLRTHFQNAGITGAAVGQELTTIFGKRAGSGIAVLYDQLDRLNSKYAEIGKGAQQFGSDWDRTQQTFSQRWKDIVAGADAFMIELGTKLIPVVTGFLTGIKDTVDWMGQHQAAIAKTAQVIATLLIPALLAWRGAEIAAIAVNLIDHLAGIGAMVGQVGAAIQGMAAGLWEALGPVGLLMAGFTVLVRMMDSSSQSARNAGAAYAAAFVTATKDSADQVGALEQKVKDLTAAQNSLVDSAYKTKGMSVDVALSYVKGTDAYKQNATEIQKLKEQIVTLNQQHQAQADAASKVVGSYDQLGQATTRDHTATDFLTASLKAETDAAKVLKSALDELIGKHVTASEAAVTYHKDIQALTDSLTANGTTLDLNTVKGRDNTTAVDNAIKSITGQAEALIKEGSTTDQVNQVLQQNINQLVGVWRQGGMTTAQINALIQQYDLVPADISTALNASISLDTGGARSAIQALADKVAAFQNQLRTVSAGKTPIGGAFAAGGITNGPTYIAGEGNAAWPEYIVATDPIYRDRSIDLWKKLGKDLHLYAAGGIIPTAASASGSGTGLGGAIGRGWAQSGVNASTDYLGQIGAALPAMFAAAQAAQQAQMGLGYPVNIPGGLAGWIAMAEAVAGVSSLWTSALAQLIMFESGGNPNAINLTDSNAAAGHPSQGLMQTIPSTFAAYALPGYGNIRNPVDNIIAGIRYIEARYGDIWHTPGMLSLARGGPYVGYDAGGVLPPGLTMAYNGTGRDEFVSRSPGGGDIHIHIHAGTVVGAGGAQQLANMIRDEIAKGDRYRTPWAH